MKLFIRDLLRGIGYDVRPYGLGRLGLNPFQDMRYFVKGQKSPVIIDVGANTGQSVDEFKGAFPDSFIHSFEPSPSTYAILQEHSNGLDGVRTWNFGVGSRPAILPFLENDHSVMSSFLAPSDSCWGTIEKTTNVEVLTLDAFANEHDIEFVHILKSDTQGYELEVFKGAERLMKENRIGLIYFEVICSSMYKNLPSFLEIFRYLLERNFSLVAFYKAHFQEDLLSWTDAMFINIDWNRRTLDPNGK